MGQESYNRTKVEFINNIYCNICSKSLKGSSREYTLFTLNFLKTKMHVKIEHTYIKKRNNKKNNDNNKI